MILTEKEKMVLTPTYYVFKMYAPFQGSTFVPIAFDPSTYVHVTSRCHASMPSPPRTQVASCGWP